MKALTPREVEALESVIRYGGPLSAAAAMDIHRTTMRNYLTSIRNKMDVDTTLQAAVAWATRNCTCGNAETAP
jgi:DNA-binding CsgD family transcriptional regulator